MSELQTITLGGGCFWCTEAVYVKVRGVTDVESGYCNGHIAKPSYEQVCTGDTGHNEVVKLVFDPAQISLEQGDTAQKMMDVMHQANSFGRPIVTEVLPLSNYWPAEDYHQDFFERNPFQGYCMAVAGPKVEKFRKTFARLVKA